MKTTILAVCLLLTMNIVVQGEESFIERIREYESKEEYPSPIVMGILELDARLEKLEKNAEVYGSWCPVCECLHHDTHLCVDREEIE